MLAQYMQPLCVSLYVCLSVTSRYCVETTRRIELVLAWELLLTHAKLCCKEIRVPPKIMVLPSGTFPQTLDL